MKYGTCLDQTCGQCALCRTRLHEVNTTLKFLKPLTVETPKISITKAQKDKIDLLVASYMMFATTKQNDYKEALKELDAKWDNMFKVEE